MTQLITKDDFSGYVKWSDNILAADVDFHCKDAQNFDAYPIMPLAKVSKNNIVLDIETAVGEDPITKPELVAFFNLFLKPFLVCQAYKRFLLIHGRNITQFGLRVNNEETSTEVSDKARAEMMADITHKCNIYLGRLTEELKRVNFTFDTIVYLFNCAEKPRSTTRIRGI